MLKQKNIKFKRRMTVAGLVAAAVSIVVPMTASAWGPERTTYTMKNPADKPTFNSITDNNVVLLLMIIFILLILGMFLEGTAVILIVAPIFLPIIAQMGMGQLQFGVIMVLASMIGLLTPPVGMSLYAVSSVTDVPMLELSKEVIPYVIGILFVLMLCAFIPPLCTWLPSILV